MLATKANESELSDYATIESLATVATSGDYDDLSNKPTIPVVPTDVSAFNNDAGYITQEEVIINEAFPNGWHTTGTMADLIADINADTDAVAGKVYMDTVSFSDLPANMQQAELKAEIISQLGNSKVIVFTVTSSEVSPYHWEYTSAYGQTNSWREWVTPAAMQSALSVKANSADLATVATTGSYNDLTNKPTIPAAQIQSDWNQSDNSAADYIKNKPVNVSTFTNDAGYLTQHQSLADYSTTQEMNTAIATATNDMATMTWVGEQGYLTQHQDISDLFNGAEYDTQTKRINFKHGNTVLAYIDATAFIKDGMVSNVEVKNVTISGESVLCLVITFNTDAGKEPINIPISSIFDASNYYTKTEADNTFVKPADLATVATSGDYTDLSNTPSLATVATTGDYDDLINKPTIPAAQVQSDWDEVDTTSKAYIQNKPTIPTVPTNVSAFTNDAGYTTNTGTITGITMNGTSKGTSGVVDLGTVITEHQSLAGYVQDTDLATVATTGDYADLTNKPVIPAAQVQSDWNEADNTSKAYIQNKPSLAAVATTGDYDDLSNKPTIPTVPTNVSAFTNDAGYTTNTGTITGITMNGVSKGTSGVVDLGTVVTDVSGKQDTLVSGTNIKTINNESILGSGNITIEGGGGISGITMNGSPVTVTSGVADLGTVVTDVSGKQDAMRIISPLNYNEYNKILSFGIQIDKGNSGEGNLKMNGKINYLNNVTGDYSVAFGTNNTVSGNYSAAIGGFDGYGAGSTVSGYSSIALGRSHNIAKGMATATGQGHTISNDYETAVGRYSQSNHSTDTFGDSGNTLFAVGNGTSASVRSNAFEVRQNGDIYISNSDHTQTIKLQDNLGGGGGGITGITMNGSDVTVTSGVANLGTVVTDISGKQDVIDSSHKLDADLVDDTTSANKFVTASDKSTWSGKQDALVSGTNIKTINNESILGSGNITIQGGGSSYTAGDNIDITNDVISVDIDDEKKVIASALVELHNDKADKNQLNNYQLKGDYQTGTQVDTKIATAVANYRTEAEAINVEHTSSAALNDLDARLTAAVTRITALETALGGMTLVSLTQAQYEALTVKDNNTLYIITPQ